ncbi:Mandelate racemase/muconate lactonizing enzyme family protein [Rhodovastum atsumiense]|uniref:Mandelate racemase/muconate lactonizing enzyme family protein n=1 Tax=Rhodovastum atsumiense TaxID=504468 RepID=A0A5M6IYN6_9PROT|nr:mandelate racemase/muconate lactonizing enzyme family protein [Rhodovastum atsumiense]KAA5613456.1 mandelate racemase/muconate lactonizing enzyme family protein [Rhodovastum atsumiense]CAH2603191.1 Mandelate racemase/muconate lactonizing enzyme family protein [Rhodovastum atsumiense]
MKIVKVEDLHADAGWRTTSFLKITTADGIVGWSEYSENVGNAGLTATIRAMAEKLPGQNPMRLEWIMAQLYTHAVPAWSGINQQAMAAIGNALLDIKGKALGVPVHALFGGALRDRLPVYWSHCGSYRVRFPEFCGVTPVRDYDGLQRLAEEVRQRGFRALKTNIMMLEPDGSIGNFRPGFGSMPGFPELNPQPSVMRSLQRQLEAMRAGAGPDVEIMLDANFHFRTEGYLQLVRTVEPFNLAWLELDIYDADSLALLRREAGFPIASGESLYTRRGYRPFLDAYAMDVAIVDVLWNGFLESMKIAAMADAYEVNVAPHNFYGHLADHISAHFAAATPNLRILEMDIDDVPWKSEFVTHPPVIENGAFVLPDRPGWGTDVDETAVRRRPPRH